MENEELFPILVDLLKTFDAFCKRHNLTYYLFGGSLLGAIRHKGIIPWDDDIDVCMPREDYERLISLHGEFKDPYFLQSLDSDNGYNKTFLKLRNCLTTEIPIKDAVFKYNHGIFLDIFPLDNVCESKKKFYLQLKEMKVLEGIIHFHSRYYSNINGLGLNWKKKIAYYIIEQFFKLRILTPKRIYDIHRRVACRYNRSKTNYIGIISFSYDNPRFIYPSDCYGRSIRTDFENIKVDIPEQYDRILHICYGEYMKPVKQPSEHGNVIINAEIPFDRYISENKEYLLSIWNQYHSRAV